MPKNNSSIVKSGAHGNEVPGKRKYDGNRKMRHDDKLFDYSGKERLCLPLRSLTPERGALGHGITVPVIRCLSRQIKVMGETETRN